MELKLIREDGVLHRPVLREEDGGQGNGKWTASVWKLDQRNLNGRTYPTALGKRIVSEGKATMAYDGHDADYRTGGEYSIARAVCDNPRIESGELVVDINFVDADYEELLVRLMDMGVQIGVSSVGYGIEDEHGVVDTGSYVLVRYLDFVTAPAGEVYARRENASNGGSDSRGGGAPPDGRLKAAAERRRKVAQEMISILSKEKR